MNRREGYPAYLPLMPNEKVLYHSDTTGVLENHTGKLNGSIDANFHYSDGEKSEFKATVMTATNLRLTLLIGQKQTANGVQREWWSVPSHRISNEDIRQPIFGSTNMCIDIAAPQGGSEDATPEIDLSPPEMEHMGMPPSMCHQHIKHKVIQKKGQLTVYFKRGGVENFTIAFLPTMAKRDCEGGRQSMADAYNAAALRFDVLKTNIREALQTPSTPAPQQTAFVSATDGGGAFYLPQSSQPDLPQPSQPAPPQVPVREAARGGSEGVKRD